MSYFKNQNIYQIVVQYSTFQGWHKTESKFIKYDDICKNFKIDQTQGKARETLHHRTTGTW